MSKQLLWLAVLLMLTPVCGTADARTIDRPLGG